MLNAGMELVGSHFHEFLDTSRAPIGFKYYGGEHLQVTSLEMSIFHAAAPQVFARI